MTNFEALKALQEGKKVKHNTFFGPTTKEWMKKSNKEGYYEYNDGTLVSSAEFWSIRKTVYAWTTNWSVVE